MITVPKIEPRPAQPTLGIRTQVPIPFGKYIPPLYAEVQAWMQKRAIVSTGAPFIRYLTTDMSKLLDIEAGFPVAAQISGDERVLGGVIPAGSYAVMLYTGPYRGKGLYKATVALLEWAKEHGVTWQTSTIDGTEWWGGRLEWYLTDPTLEPDPKKWQTELAFLIKD